MTNGYNCKLLCMEQQHSLLPFVVNTSAFFISWLLIFYLPVNRTFKTVIPGSYLPPKYTSMLVIRRQSVRIYHTVDDRQQCFFKPRPYMIFVFSFMPQISGQN